MIRFARWLDSLSSGAFLGFLLLVIWGTTGCVTAAYAAGAAVVDAVPTSAPLISDQVAMLLGLAALGAVASAAASAWNAYLRALKKQGRRVGAFGLAFGAFLNGLALNFDQAARQAQAAREPKQ